MTNLRDAGGWKNCGVREVEKIVGCGRLKKLRGAAGWKNAGCGRLKKLRGAAGWKIVEWGRLKKCGVREIEKIAGCRRLKKLWAVEEITESGRFKNCGVRGDWNLSQLYRPSFRLGQGYLSISYSYSLLVDLKASSREIWSQHLHQSTPSWLYNVTLAEIPKPKRRSSRAKGKVISLWLESIFAQCWWSKNVSEPDSNATPDS